MRRKTNDHLLVTMVINKWSLVFRRMTPSQDILLLLICSFKYPRCVSLLKLIVKLIEVRKFLMGSPTKSSFACPVLSNLLFRSKRIDSYLKILCCNENLKHIEI